MYPYSICRDFPQSSSVGFMEASKIEVWIVDDDSTLREQVRSMINNARDVWCSEAFVSCEEMFDFIDNSKISSPPDVVVLDYILDGIAVGGKMTGVEGTRLLKKKFPELAIVMLTINDSTDVIFQAIGSGACGYLVKPPPVDVLLSSIRQAYEGGLWMPPMVAQRVSRYFQENHGDSQNILSPREKEVLSMMERGMKQKQIAETLNLSRHTIDSHFRNIYKKLHVHSAHEAIAKAIRKGYL